MIRFQCLVVFLFGMFNARGIAQGLPPGTTITITLPNGLQLTKPATKWMVVERTKYTYPPRTIISWVNAHKQKRTLQITKQKRYPQITKKNSLIAHGGLGYDGFLAEYDDDEGTIKFDRQLVGVFGLTYMRVIGDTWSWGLTGMSNETGTLNMGFRW